MVHTGLVLRRPAALALVLVLAAGLGCSSEDGRSLPAPDLTKPTTSVSAPVGAPASLDGDAIEVFTLASPAFADGGVIPEVHTCTGADISPPLQWASTPAAAELALVVRDRDAEGFVHWVVTGIDPTVQGLGAGGVSETAVEAANDAGTIGWFGPCPPAGTGTHTYDFVLHALPEPLALEPGRPADEAASLVEGASAATARLSGTVTAGD